MGGTHVRRTKTEPFRIPPAFGQCSENNVKVRSNIDTCNVFQEEVARSHVVSNAEDVKEEGGSVGVDAAALTGGTEVLAGEASGHEVNRPASINDSAEHIASEGGDVRPDRAWR